MRRMDGKKPKSDRDRHLLIMVSVAFSSFMAGLNNYIVNISLPSIAGYFNTGTEEVSRVILSYLLISTSSLFLFGRLGDRIGLKKVFVAGYVVFTLGCLLCGLSTSITMLAGFRLVQGAGGAMLLACGYAVIARFLPGDRIGRAYGITLTCFAVGIATGAPLGGLITGYVSWHWIFFTNVPVGIIAIVVAIRSIPGEAGRRASTAGKKEGFDVPGSLLAFFGLGALLYGLSVGKTDGWLSRPILVSLGCAGVLLVLFVLREKTCVSPLLDFNLFRNRSLTFALLTSLTSLVLLGGNAFLLPFYLQIIRQLSVQQTGMMLLIYSLVQILLTPHAGRLSDRVSPHILCTASLASAVLCAFFFSSALKLDTLVPAFILVIWLPFSYAFFLAPNANRVMRLTSEGRHGTASGLLSTASNLSMMFGVVVFETVFSHSFARILPKSGNIFRSGIPREVLLCGFSHAYIAGGVICLLACLFSYKAGTQKQ